MIVPIHINLLSEEERVVTQAIPFRTQVIEDSSLWPWQRVEAAWQPWKEKSPF